MRVALLLLIAGALLPALVVGADAFNAGASGTRTISVALVGDANAYLAIAARTGPHSCFVTESATTGKLAIDFASAAGCSAGGTGTGVNKGDGSDATKYSRYAFHDLLQVTNKGTTSFVFWANASTTSSGGSAVTVAKKSTTGAMSDSDYAASSATGLTVAVGSSAYIGVRVNTGTLDTGSVGGTIDIAARR